MIVIINSSVNIHKLESVLKILGDKTRLIILSKLNRNELCVCDIVGNLDISQPAVSQHLRKMKDLEIITEEKRGQWSYYKINKANPLYELIKGIVDMVEIE
ncbi:MAG: metalloregulator ArsR/SmtB family transcription factor [Clostridia bacterium]|nr:metalloregulator ArsR/SmtB family transcription factor [Clostridia bacterium]